MEGGEVVLLVVKFLEHSLYGAERFLQFRVSAFSSALGRTGLVITAGPSQQRGQLTFGSGQAVFPDILSRSRRSRQETRVFVFREYAARACEFCLGTRVLGFDSPSEGVTAVGLSFLHIREADDGL